MKSVIITGANGFLGRNTTKLFIENGVEVIAVVRPNDQNRPIEHGLLKYYSADMTQPNSLIKTLPHKNYDVFIHFAWEGSAGAERFDYNLQLQNAISTVESLKTAHLLGCNRFVCASSIAEKEALLALESKSDISFPATMYGFGKLVAHSLCRSVAADIGIDLLWLIVTNVFGEKDLSPRFINTTINKIIYNESLEFLAATQNYDFVYISDAARAFFLISKFGKPFCEYLIGSSNAMPLKNFILDIKKELASDVPLLFDSIPYTGINLPIDMFSTNQTEVHTGFKASVPFADGVRKTYEWLKSIKCAD